MAGSQTVLVCEVKHDALTEDIKEMKAASLVSEKKRSDDLDKIYKRIDSVGDKIDKKINTWGGRLPTWGVMLMTAGGGLIGILVTIVGFLLKIKF